MTRSDCSKSQLSSNIIISADRGQDSHIHSRSVSLSRHWDALSVLHGGWFMCTYRACRVPVHSSRHCQSRFQEHLFPALSGAISYGSLDGMHPLENGSYT